VGHRLDGVRERVSWANDHFDALGTKVRKWVHRNLHSGNADFYPEAGIHVFRWEAPDPPLLWSVMCGNIVHNLRSALDHLVWQMVLANGIQAPKTGSRGNAFPIKVTPPGKGETFASIYAKNGKLAGVHPDHIALIEEFQPYKVIPHGASANEHPLALLDELWQIDKHRHLHFTSFILPPEPRMKLRFKRSDDSAYLLDVHFFEEPRKLKRGEVLAWFRAKAVGPQPHLDVNLDLPAHPAIDEIGTISGPPGNEGMAPLGQTLGRIGRCIDEIVKRASATPPF
jgi:hypothetical protein